MHVRSLGGAVVVAVIIIVALGAKFTAKSGRDEQYRTEAYELVSHCDKYREHQGYIIGLCDAAHDAAFDKAYTMGSRRRRSSFDEGKYYSELFTTMRDRANLDGRNDVAVSISKLASDFASGKIRLEPRKSGDSR